MFERDKASCHHSDMRQEKRLVKLDVRSGPFGYEIRSSNLHIRPLLDKDSNNAICHKVISRK